MDRKSRDSLNEEQFRSVIARAIEFDDQRVTTSKEELRLIASEIGISPESVEAALLECTRSLEPKVPERSTGAASMVAASGIPLGIAAGTLLGSVSPLATFTLGVLPIGLVASGALVIAQGRKVTLRSFLLRNFLLWGGVTIGGAVTVGLFGIGPFAIPGIMVGWGMFGWISSSILGSAAVIAVRRAVTPSGTAGDSTTPVAADSMRNRVFYATKRIADWLSRLVRRAMVVLVRPGNEDRSSVHRALLARSFCIAGTCSSRARLFNRAQLVELKRVRLHGHAGRWQLYYREIGEERSSCSSVSEATGIARP